MPSAVLSLSAAGDSRPDLLAVLPGSLRLPCLFNGEGASSFLFGMESVSFDLLGGGVGGGEDSCVCAESRLSRALEAAVGSMKDRLGVEVLAGASLVPGDDPNTGRFSDETLND